MSQMMQKAIFYRKITFRCCPDFPVASWQGCPPGLWSRVGIDMISGNQPFTTSHVAKTPFAPWVYALLPNVTWGETNIS